ncbi:Sodium/hydrogen exchanger family-domain-containing protein [Hypoxylon trugodes]|uniref:Sodium/hydrogen exchanger family-domain-containing protein n=1 Tax=Hypoxylon trugodes TaxID=326681 RepID=UPI00219C33D7|nr:Sodium/hydrogen exchanger family-domain-containing protein [Hypoxylon trugodes]KAI1388772.1 Sodium/hydrogen exchanger family-domain-containing protein [Hypoxylon trugodes]
MPTLALTNFNIVVSVLGGWISVFGLVSYLLKENFYLSEALISLMSGLTFSPHAANFVRPLEYAGSEENLNAITLYFTRLVLGVQLVLAGVQLPSRYLLEEWKPLALLLGPIMTAMWMITSLLVWGLVPNLPFLHALVIGACVTPTDPVLSNVIVKGRFADHNVPKDLQKIIIAESGANDGLGYPFLYFALYLIKYIGDGGVNEKGGAGLAMGLWFGETWGYTIILSVIYGAAVGWVAKELLHFCEERKFVDRESFLVFAFSLALFITGTCGMIGSDDILACFVAGNVFTWDDWFRLRTLDEWHSFVSNSVIPIYRLIPLGILILLFRRLPLILVFYKKIPQIDGWRQAVFMGFFGPIGCSAIFYLYITLEFVTLLNPDEGNAARWDVANLREGVLVLVWFMVICSVVVHGLSIPLGKFGVYLPRTISRTLSSPEDIIPFQINSRLRSRSRSRSRTALDTPTESRSVSARPMYRIGGSIIKENTAVTGPPVGPPTRPPTVQLSTANEIIEARDKVDANSRSPDTEAGPGSLGSTPSPTQPSRTIRFPDEASSASKEPRDPEKDTTVKS